MSATQALWIGLAEVIAGQKCDVLKEGYAAFVPVVANAFGAKHFTTFLKSSRLWNWN